MAAGLTDLARKREPLRFSASRHTMLASWAISYLSMVVTTVKRKTGNAESPFVI